MLTPRPANVHRQVLDALGREICAADITALPNEAALCARFGASRTVVREAVKSLAAKGLLEVRPKTGTTIRPRQQWNLLDPDVVAWRSAGVLDDRFVADLLELRRIIEPSAGRLAAERATAEDKEAIASALALMAEATAGRGDYIPADLTFHAAVLAACHNQFLQQMQSALAVIQRTSFILSTRIPGGAVRSMPMHQALADAITQGDPAAAEQATLALIARAEEHLRFAVATLPHPSKGHPA
jgi:GntR family transcriptional regulator, galactonate operon transcriptional repressor